MSPEDDIQSPIRKANMINTCILTHISTCILMSVQTQDSLSNKLDRLRKSTVQGNQLTRLSPYINTGFPCDKKSLSTDLHKCWNHRETLSTLSIESRTLIMMNTIMNTICMITTQYLMSEHSSDSISNRLAQPEKNILQKKYITRLEGYNNTDQLCDRESLPTDLPESWSHKELLHNQYGLINHEDKIVPVTHKEVYLLSRPSMAMAQWKIQYIQKEVYILSRPRFKYMQKEVYILSRPSTDHSIITQYTSREKDEDLPQLPSTLEAQEKITLEDQASMLRCSDVRETGHTHSQSTESEKAKSQTPFTSNEARNHIEHNSVENISQDLVHLTKSDTASASLISEPEEREEIAETADTPALERAEEQSHTPESKIHCRYTCTCTGGSRGTVAHSRIQKSLYEPNKLTFTCKMVIKTLSQSGLVDYQSEMLNFGLYILHTRARSAIVNSSRNICKCIVKDLES